MPSTGAANTYAVGGVVGAWLLLASAVFFAAKIRSRSSIDISMADIPQASEELQRHTARKT